MSVDRAFSSSAWMRRSANAGYLRQALAALISAVPLHQLDFDDLNFAFKLSKFPGLQCKELPRQFGHCLVDRDLLQQSLNPTYALRHGHAKLDSKTSDRI